MNTQILREKTERLNQRLRILILQNAGEGSVYDDHFLFEVHLISEQLMQLKRSDNQQARPEGRLRNVGKIQALVAQTG